MAKKKRRRKRSTSEKVMLVLGIIIALSMLASLIVGLGSGGSQGNAPLPESERIEEIYIEPVSAIDGGQPGLTWFAAGMAPQLM
jgi:hypothetical protein